MAFNLEQALDARANLASPARKENEGRDENRLSKAQMEGLAELISDFFNSIDPHLRQTPDRNPAVQQSPVCYPFRSQAREDRAVNRRSFITIFGGTTARVTGGHI